MSPGRAVWVKVRASEPEPCGVARQDALRGLDAVGSGAPLRWPGAHLDRGARRGRARAHPRAGAHREQPEPDRPVGQYPQDGHRGRRGDRPPDRHRAGARGAGPRAPTTPRLRFWPRWYPVPTDQDRPLGSDGDAGVAVERASGSWVLESVVGFGFKVPGPGRVGRRVQRWGAWDAMRPPSMSPWIPLRPLPHRHPVDVGGIGSVVAQRATQSLHDGVNELGVLGRASIPSAPPLGAAATRA